MKSKKTTLRPNLILLFCAAVFLITTGSMLLIGSIFVLLIHMGFFIRPRPFFLFLAIAVSSILISTLLARLIGEKIFAPIKELNHATKQIADGNFRVSIKEEGTVAEVREMAHNFNRMAEELRRTEIIHNDFARNVSHEFKTPLSSIEGYASPAESRAVGRKASGVCFSYHRRNQTAHHNDREYPHAVPPGKPADRNRTIRFFPG